MKLRHLILPVVATLALAACSGAEEETGLTTGDAIDPIAAPAGQEWSQTVSETEAGGMVMGNPEAPIKLVEYMSLTCPHCADFGAAAFEKIRDEYVASGRVSFEIRNFVRDPIDLTTAILTRCGPDSSFFALTEASLGDLETVMANAQEADQKGFFAGLEGVEPAKRPAQIAQAIGLIDIFKQRGISEDQAMTCLNDEATMTALTEATAKAGSEENITGTPTFKLNGKTVEGTNWPMVENALRTAGAR